MKDLHKGLALGIFVGYGGACALGVLTTVANSPSFSDQHSNQEQSQKYIRGAISAATFPTICGRIFGNVVTFGEANPDGFDAFVSDAKATIAARNVSPTPTPLSLSR